MSEDFVDVTWRGLEVVKKARLRCKDARTAYVEHGTPMPTGTQLAIRTADGLDLAAVVERVQEQIGGRTEPPGMELVVETTGAAATWWLGRIEAHTRSVRAAARQTLIMTQLPGAVPELAVAPIMAVIDTGPMTAASASALAAPPPVAEPPTIRDLPAPPGAVSPAAATPGAVSPAAVPATPSARTTQPLHLVAPKAVAAAKAEPVSAPARTTQLMHTVAGSAGARDRTQHAAPDEATEHLSAAPQPAGAATDPADARDGVPAGIDDSADGPVEGLVDDGRRTIVMDAVDIDAIVSASADATPAPDDEPGAGNGDKKKAARGKKRRGR